ncbi:MAG: hypothetical protein J7J91_10035 [Deltaproteobacteria bacterium]|nr:hypothetical protein [Deltaproteobacteria bacterium]
MTEPKPLDLNFEKILKIIEDDFGDFRKAYEVEKYIKQRIRVACEFYLRYIYDPWLLWEERHEFRCEKLREFMKDIVENEDTAIEDSAMYEYNKWLFKEAFKIYKNEGDREC